MKKKKLHIKLEYELTVEEFSDSMAACRLEKQRSNTNHYCETVIGIDAWENIRRQKRLLLALLNDSKLIKEYLLHAAVEQFGQDTCYNGFSKLVADPDSLSILKKAIKLLDRADQEFYEKIIADDSLVEHIEVICDAINGHVTNMDLVWLEEEVSPPRGFR